MLREGVPWKDVADAIERSYAPVRNRASILHIRAAAARNVRKWSEGEKETVWWMRREGVTLEDIAQSLGLSGTLV